MSRQGGIAGRGVFVTGLARQHARVHRVNEIKQQLPLVVKRKLRASAAPGPKLRPAHLSGVEFRGLGRLRLRHAAQVIGLGRAKCESRLGLGLIDRSVAMFHRLCDLIIGINDYCRRMNVMESEAFDLDPQAILIAAFLHAECHVALNVVSAGRQQIGKLTTGYQRRRIDSVAERTNTSGSCMSNR